MVTPLRRVAATLAVLFAAAPKRPPSGPPPLQLVGPEYFKAVLDRQGPMGVVEGWLVTTLPKTGDLWPECRMRPPRPGSPR